MSFRLTLAAALLASGCTLDFDGFDPRFLAAGGGTGGVPSTGGGGTGMTTSATGGMGGQDLSGGGGAFGGGGAGGEGGSGGQTVEVAASIADCIDPVAPDPDACAASQPPNTMGVDGAVMMVARHSYLRFDLPPAIAGATRVSAVLELTVSDAIGAESGESGVIWQVEPFTRDDLFVAAPALVGASPLVGNQGAVTQNQTVPFKLPTPLPLASGSLFLGVLPLTTDGIDYWNDKGAVPPKLIVTVE